MSCARNIQFTVKRGAVDRLRIIPFLVLGICLLGSTQTLRAQGMPTLQYNANTGQFLFSVPTAPGTLLIQGTRQPNHIAMTVRLQADLNVWHGLELATVNNVTDIQVTFSGLGSIAYRYLPDDTFVLLSHSIADCPALQADPVFLATQEAFANLALVHQEWAASPQANQIEQIVDTLVGFFAKVDAVVQGCSTMRPQDLRGCDPPANFLSCTPKGACCDEHDRCYASNDCDSSSWLRSALNPMCHICNLVAADCVLTKNPGPSECCFTGACMTQCPCTGQPYCSCG